jgi:hypothetical protein
LSTTRWIVRASGQLSTSFRIDWANSTAVRLPELPIAFLPLLAALAGLVLIRADALNMQPAHDPAAAVMQPSVANIDSVMAAGRWRKRSGRLLVDGIETKLEQLRESGQRIVEAMGLRAAAVF